MTIRQRKTVRTHQPIVLFLIGARILKWWAIHQWLPVVLAMGKMLRLLRQDPELAGRHVLILHIVPNVEVLRLLRLRLPHQGILHLIGDRHAE